MRPSLSVSLNTNLIDNCNFSASTSLNWLVSHSDLLNTSNIWLLGLLPRKILLYKTKVNEFSILVWPFTILNKKLNEEY